MSGCRRSYGGGALSIDLGIWDFLWRSLVFVIGIVLVIPAPWVATWFYRWIVSRLYVPGRPNFAFTGQVGDIWYVFVAIGILTYVGAADLYYLQYLSIPIQAVSVLDGRSLDRLESQLQRPAAADRLQRQRAGLCRLASAVVSLRHHHHRLGLGGHGLDALDLPQHRAARGAKSSSTHPDWKCCGEPSCL